MTWETKNNLVLVKKLEIVDLEIRTLVGKPIEYKNFVAQVITYILWFRDIKMKMEATRICQNRNLSIINNYWLPLRRKRNRKKSSMLR